MDHYTHLILKGLINRGGSSSETYTYRLLTGDCSDSSESVSHMWGYLDNPLKFLLCDVLEEICGVDLDPITNFNDKEMVRVLIDYMADKSGRREFFDTHSRQDIERMSDHKYEKGIADLIQAKKVQLLNKE